MFTMLAMGGLGIALHFLGRWGEHWRTVQKINAWHYVRMDPPGWLAASSNRPMPRSVPWTSKRPAR